MSLPDLYCRKFEIIMIIKQDVFVYFKYNCTNKPL